jgi:hypothetical protein
MSSSKVQEEITGVDKPPSPPLEQNKVGDRFEYLDDDEHDVVVNEVYDDDQHVLVLNANMKEHLPVLFRWVPCGLSEYGKEYRQRMEDLLKQHNVSSIGFFELNVAGGGQFSERKLFVF